MHRSRLSLAIFKVAETGFLLPFSMSIEVFYMFMWSGLDGVVNL